MNQEAFPESANVYDSLAEAYLVNGEKKLAAKYSEKVLEILQNNSNANERIKESLSNNAKYRLKSMK